MEPATMMGELGEFISPEDKVSIRGSRVDLRALNFEQMDRITIGRTADNDVVLNHPLVSRYVFRRPSSRHSVRPMYGLPRHRKEFRFRSCMP